MKNNADIIDIDVVEATSAVTPETTISTLDGHVQPVGDMGYSLLIADPTVEDNMGTVAMLSVNTKTNEVQGIIQRSKEKAIKIKQKNGKQSFAEQDDDFVPPAWACGVTEKEKDSPANSKHSNLFGRALVAEEDRLHHHEEHAHHESDHSHAQQDFEEIRTSLRGSNVRFGGRRKLQTSSSYSYQVNMFIEIDQSFVNQSGGQAGAIQYVNTLITAANTVYEHEIDTHLHVAKISITSIYDSSGSASNALDKMRSTYASNSWHYDGVDLHHAMLGRSLGGGVA